MGQLPKERLAPGSVFDQVGVDYAGPVLIKYGHVRKPTIVKAWICVFISFSVKAVHLEPVSDLTSEAFLDVSLPDVVIPILYGVTMGLILLVLTGN